MSQIPFPGGAADQDVFFHEDKVCVYHKDINTWECRTALESAPNTPDPPDTIYTTDVYIPGGYREELQAAMDAEVPGETAPAIRTQYDANQALLQQAILGSKNTGRTSDLIDFTNNSVTQAYWVHTQVDEDPFPNQAEFWAYDEDGNETTQFADIRKIIFNDNGIVANPGTENKLQDVRIGDYLIMQEVDENHFGMYVITNKTTYQGSIREFELKVYRDARAYGSCDYLAHCSVRVIRPSYVVVQDDLPAVSDRGILWYRQSDDVLSISNYADGFTGTGPQWTEINGSTGGGVSVGENPPNDPAEGALWFDTARLELYVYYVEGEDGAWIPASPLGARVSAGEILQQQILGRVDAIEADYLKLDQANDVTTSFRIKADGSTLISSSGNELGLYHVKDPTNGNPEWAATKGYVDSKIGGGGGSFQDKYDGNRECIANASSVTTLSSGQVMFLNNQLVSTTQPALVEVIGLPLDEFNWASCIKSGVIKVTNGIYEAGYYQVYKTKETNGRNMLVYVTPLWFDVDQSLQAGGTPCYFQGVFFE